MSDVFGLLGLNRDILENFALQGRWIENDVETDRMLKNHTRRLKSIEERMQDDGRRPLFNAQSVDAVIEKVKRCSGGHTEEWTLKEIRLISYYLIRFRNEQKVFDYALYLLERNWRDLLINGLMFFLMNSWNSCPDNLLIGVRELLKRHLVNYDGSIKRYLILKDQTDMLEKAGPARMASLLSAKQLTLKQAPGILGYKESSLSFPYFSDVIINYFRRKPEIDYDAMEEILKKHTLDRTKKLMYAFLIEKAEDSCDGNFQGAVVRSARRMLGDINVATTWSPFIGATDEEVWQLNKAKDLVVAWGARKTVEAFFDRVQDPRRRIFWLDYVGSISDYRIVGSKLTKTQFQSNPEVAPLLRSCFIETNSRVSTTSALVLFIKDKVFVEFSDIGALYIYNSNHYIIRDIKRKHSIDSIANLKDPSMGVAVEQSYAGGFSYYNEGKIHHRGEWEGRLNRWMQCQMAMSPGQKAKYAVPKPSNFNNGHRFGLDKIEDEKTTSRLPSTTSKVDRHDSTWIVSPSPQQSLFTEEEAPSVNTSQSGDSHPLHPGTRVKKEIRGLQSKWIFDDTCRILADKEGIYVYVKKNQRTYFVAPNKLDKINGCSIWLTAFFNSKTKYNVQLAIPNKLTGKPRTQVLGTIELIGKDIAFTPLNGTKANIHFQ